MGDDDLDLLHAGHYHGMNADLSAREVTVARAQRRGGSDQVVARSFVEQLGEATARIRSMGVIHIRSGTRAMS